MTVRAKFFVTDVNHHPVPGEGVCAEVKMAPVFGTYDDGDGEANKAWSEHTPSGALSMMITNPDAVAEFSRGDAFFIDFTPCGKISD